MEILEKTVDVLPDTSRNAVFEGLYQSAFPVFARFAARMQGSFDDAKDTFHDALVIYYEKSMQESFSVRTTPEAYVIGIARHLWLKRFRRDGHRAAPDQLKDDALPSDYYGTVDENRLLHFLERTSRKCLDLLAAFYFEKNPLKEIAAAFGYRNERSAAVQKFKCLGKMRNAVRMNKMNYEDFLH